MPDEPLLFAFVERICRAVGAPTPKRIDVDCQVNASAGFRRGWWSVLVGGDLVLTIGLPLAAGFTTRQFAGVLAHEFGHFSQRVGMRFSYVIRSVSNWFARVVYQRDQWDETLDNWARQSDLRIGIVLHAARFCVWLAREIIQRSGRLLEKLQEFQRDSITTDYPFDHAKGRVSMAGYLMPNLPEPENVVEAFHVADSILDTLPPMYSRIVATLCEMAENAETSLGLSPLEAPPAPEPPPEGPAPT